MGDDLPEKLYMAWRSALLSSQPDLPSWGNVRDPDVRAAWEAAAALARGHVQGQCSTDLQRELTDYRGRHEGDVELFVENVEDLAKLWSVPS